LLALRLLNALFRFQLVLSRLPLLVLQVLELVDLALLLRQQLLLRRARSALVPIASSRAPHERSDRDRDPSGEPLLERALADDLDHRRFLVMWASIHTNIDPQ
jgi:hypothetical protein